MENPRLKQYNFNDIAFLTGVKPYTLDELLKRELYAAKVEKCFPINIEAAAKKTKIYYEPEHIIISLDNNIDKTILLILGLDDDSKRKIDIRHEFIQNSEMARSNSFIDANVLYQFRVVDQEWVISLVDYISDSIINSIRINRSNFNSFINTETSFFGGNNEFVTYKDMDKDEAEIILKKTHKYNPVICVVDNNDDKLQLIMGGYKYESQSAGVGLPGSSSMVSLNGGVPSFITECFAMLFDRKSYSHLSEKMDNCKIGNVSNFIESKENGSADGKKFTVYKNHLSAIKMFRYNDQYYLGYYLKENKKYSLYRF